MLKRVLFLCSANYYRSRFAEHLFNWLAPQLDLAWYADSRGLLVGNWGYVGPIAESTVDALLALGIPIDEEHRDPEPLTSSDLARFDLVVAVKESEHRPEMVEQFSDWADRIEYWDVDDLDCATPDVALPYLEEKVRALVSRLQDGTLNEPAKNEF